MTSQAALAFRGRNPDVVTCIANLSNDEVFTPPELSQQMLNMVATAWADSHDGASIWADPAVRFLDPFTKSGVFLREITARLVTGLASAIPDLQERVDHILTKQVFGIAVTELTALLARRTLYCSKRADGPHSIGKALATPNGNIWFERTEHSWSGDRCSFCGASKSALERGSELDSHAYAVIHTSNIRSRMRDFFGEHMHFDVVIGNPPFQLNDGGGSGSSAVPIYNLFVEQAKKLEPSYLAMVIPSRWFTGGKGLDDFRDSMLMDTRIRRIVDYPISAEVFPRNGPKGGVCYFLRDLHNPGQCSVTTNFLGGSSTQVRPLRETGSDVFVRFHEGVQILKKVARREGVDQETLALKDEFRFDPLVSARKPFGFSSTFRGRPKQTDDDLVLIQRGGQNAFVSRGDVKSGLSLVDSWKVFVGFAAPGTGNRDTYPHRIISTPFIGRPGEVCTETYLAIGAFGSAEEAESVKSYLECRLVRFLVLLHKPSQNTTRHVYTFVPRQAWNKIWTDCELYDRYGLSQEEIAFVESIVRPMQASDDNAESMIAEAIHDD
jgi:site-specific DNA-methyltransferase (adenine-specific)